MDIERSCGILKTLADETRLKIVNILAAGDSYTELIASKLSITEATVCYHLKKMEKSGIVTSSRSQFYIMYSLNEELLSATVRDIVILPKTDEVIDTDEKYRREVIANFFRYGKLISLPVQRKKRDIVLEEIAKSFEAGKDYTEPEVNEVIKQYHEDYCLVRREMISSKIMTRENGRYRKI